MTNDDMAPAAMMGRFFVECQELLNEVKINLEAVARLRNALYGPSTPPIDWKRMENLRALYFGSINKPDPTVTEAYILRGLRRDRGRLTPHEGYDTM